MAFSSSKLREENVGTLKLQVYDVNFASVTEGHVKSGFNNVVGAWFNNEVSEAQGLVVPNKDSAGSATEFGGVRVSGVTSSDTGKLFVLGY